MNGLFNQRKKEQNRDGARNLIHLKNRLCVRLDIIQMICILYDFEQCLGLKHSGPRKHISKNCQFTTDFRFELIYKI